MISVSGTIGSDLPIFSWNPMEYRNVCVESILLLAGGAAAGV